MLKKLLCVFMALTIGLILFGCSDKDSESVSTDKWNGTYMWLDEETEEFKLLEAVSINEETVSFVLESSRKAEEFEAHTKSASGRYLVENLGSKTVKITLSNDFETVVVDDMWTDDISKREENWTGKYHRVIDLSEIPAFGDKSWNGRYLSEETGLVVSVYGIREGYALFNYKGTEDGEEVLYNLRLLEPEKGKAVYTEGERLIILELLTKGRLKVTDLYMNDSSNKGISGIYKKK